LSAKKLNSCRGSGKPREKNDPFSSGKEDNVHGFGLSTPLDTSFHFIMPGATLIEALTDLKAGLPKLHVRRILSIRYPDQLLDRKRHTEGT